MSAPKFLSKLWQLVALIMVRTRYLGSSPFDWVNAEADLGTLNLRWDTVTNRVYSLWQSPEAGAGFIPIPDAQTLPATVREYQLSPGAASDGQFYQLRVELP